MNTKVARIKEFVVNHKKELIISALCVVSYKIGYKSGVDSMRVRQEILMTAVKDGVTIEKVKSTTVF